MLLGRRGGRGGWRREGRRGGVDKGSQWGHHARVSTRASHGLQTVGAKRCDMDTWPAGDRTKERVAVDICRTSRTGHGAWSGSRCGASFRGCCRWGWAADEQRVATETGAAMGELHRRRSEGGASAAVQASYFGRYLGTSCRGPRYCARRAHLGAFTQTLGAQRERRIYE